jgi:hypothetical protein
MVDVTPLEFLEAVYCNEELPLTVRMRAAIEAAPYKHPKLSVVASTPYDESFAVRLELAIELSRSPLLLNPPPVLNGQVEPLPPSAAAKPMSRYRRF